MLNKLLRHPILRNPAVWLEGPKYHSPELLSKSFYDSELLKKNPFALSMLSTRMDGSRKRFPKGQMIQLVVDTDNAEISHNIKSFDRTYYLVPALEEPDKRKNLFTSFYIINNRTYVEYCLGGNKWRRFVPQKFRYSNHSRLESRLKVLPNMADVIESGLRARISLYLECTVFDETTEPKEQTILLICGNISEPLWSMRDGQIIVNMNRIYHDFPNQSKSTLVAYSKHYQFIQDLFFLIDFLT